MQVSLNESSSPNLTELLNYKFEFMPAVIHSPVQTIVLKFRNNGYLTTAFHVHFPNEKKLELEVWCDEEEPSEELNRLICIIEELKLFTFEPHSAVLQPGETCNVTVSYKHNSLKYNGLHNLPLLVQLSQGKQFYVDLIGRTLPVPHASNAGNRRKSNFTSVSYNSLPSAVSAPPGTAASAKQSNISNNAIAAAAAIAHIPDFLLVVASEPGAIVRLSPVPVGLSISQAPLQRIELINVSGVNISYEVESQSLDQLCEDNFRTPIMRVANPTGTVPALGSCFLEVRFFALEAKVYEFPLRIKYMHAYVAPSAFERSPGNFSESGLITSNSFAVNSNNNARKGTAQSHGGRSGAGSNLRSGMYSPGTSGANTAAAAPAGPPPPAFLELHMQAIGYDPREPKPVRLESHYQGGLPPRSPLLTLPSQKLILSEDLLQFEVVPQLCTARRMTVLRNTSTSAPFEFVVDESSCILCVDGLLSIKPLFGRIEPQEIVVLEFTFTAYAQAMAFDERVKIMVREVIKGTANKKSGMRDALLKKIANRKVKRVGFLFLCCV
jgi:hypothetical protein